jgi:hypothetical protein
MTEELNGANRDLQAKRELLLAGYLLRVIIPIVAATAYGIYNFIVLGFSSKHYLFTYVLVLGGAAAVTGVTKYYSIICSNLAHRTVSWKNLLALLGLIAYLFQLYIIGFLGLFAIYRGVVIAFSFWSIVGGIFWLAIGYYSLNQFYLMTEIVRRYDEALPRK